MSGDKYAAKAEGWSKEAYADARGYLSHRAQLILSLGPSLRAGDSLLDLACGDGGLAEYLPGIRYMGVDVTEAMVAEAAIHGRDVVLADLNDYMPPEPVDATTCFRAIYYAHDRRAFFRHVAGYTTRKFVFDLNPRRFRIEDVRGDLLAAGFDRLTLRPFFAPQTQRLPSALLRGLHALERSGPVARALLAMRFSYLCAAFRGGRKM
jgi:SAM-dependent methyltransferase